MIPFSTTQKIVFTGNNNEESFISKEDAAIIITVQDLTKKMQLALESKESDKYQEISKEIGKHISNINKWYDKNFDAIANSKHLLSSFVEFNQLIKKVKEERKEKIYSGFFLNMDKVLDRENIRKEQALDNARDKIEQEEYLKLLKASQKYFTYTTQHNSSGMSQYLPKIFECLCCLPCMNSSIKTSMI